MITMLNLSFTNSVLGGTIKRASSSTRSPCITVIPFFTWRPLCTLFSACVSTVAARRVDGERYNVSLLLTTITDCATHNVIEYSPCINYESVFLFGGDSSRTIGCSRCAGTAEHFLAVCGLSGGRPARQDDQQ